MASSHFSCALFSVVHVHVRRSKRKINGTRERERDKARKNRMIYRVCHVLKTKAMFELTYSVVSYLSQWTLCVVLASSLCVRHVHTCMALSKQLGNHRSMHLANGIMLSNWMHFTDVRQPTTHWVYDHDAYDKLMMHQRTRWPCHTLTTHMNIGNEILETVDEMKFIRFFFVLLFFSCKKCHEFEINRI